MEQKFAIITDIHGNNAALSAVLNDIDCDPNINHIYCLGDLIGIGHETNEVLDQLFSRNDIIYVIGNHDEAVLDILSGKEPESVGEEREHHQWVAAGLSSEFLPKLQNMPKEHRETIAGKKCRFIHYHMDQNLHFLPIDHRPTIDRLDELYQDAPADIICFGHHHFIHHFRSNQGLYINPSSLGCHQHPLAPYAKVKIGESGEIDVSFIEVPYDNKAFLLQFEKENVPAKDFILKNFYGNQHLDFI
ncbi:metallophosphoesterase family protein [Aquisalibacillus elongatus]|uniref:metallophosphoesterase family protein n=1 Tax=Aquisalibacillus elongatus TaxID=485577 RepID=UPI000F51CAE1|nr:metallophosphoesterase family protein [Aquisalibacillus elongatus]